MRAVQAVAFGLVVAACGPSEVVDRASSSELPSSNAYSMAAPKAKARAAVASAAPKCGPGTLRSAEEALPNERIIGMFGVDVQHMQRGKVFADLETAIRAESPEVLTAMNDCKVPLSSVDSMAFGFSDNEDIVLAIKAPTIGTPATIDCFAKAIEAETGSAPWARTTTGCDSVLDDPKGKSTGFSAGPNMVVFASPNLEKSVAQRVRGKGRAALDGRFGWARRDVDRTGSMWFALELPRTMASELSSSLPGILRGSMSLDASKGVGLQMGMGFDSATNAKGAKSIVEGQAMQMRALAPMLGLDPSVVDSLKVRAKGTNLRMDLFLDEAAVASLRKAIEDATGGSTATEEKAPVGAKRRGI